MKLNESKCRILLTTVRKQDRKIISGLLLVVKNVIKTMAYLFRLNTGWKKDCDQKLWTT